MKKLMSLLAVLVSTLCLSGCEYLLTQPEVIYEEPAAIVEEVDADEYEADIVEDDSSETVDVDKDKAETVEVTQADEYEADIVENDSSETEDVDKDNAETVEVTEADESETIAVEETGDDKSAVDTVEIDENGSYDSKDEVALYIHLYGKLPSNYISKKDAQALGWSSGSLEPYAPGKSIGGSRFGNYEGLLPEAKGRTYTECDIDTKGKKKRGSKRIVFSNDGLIYYTEDHYETFELLYGEE